MKVIRVTPRGYCYGVVKSIKMVKDLNKQYQNETIYLLGYLVHNKHVINELTNLNVRLVYEPNKTRLELIELIPDYSLVVLSAHGSSDALKMRAEEKHLKIVDTECEWVTKTKDLINEHLQLKHNVIFIGVNHHPETEAIIGINSNIHLVTDVESLNNVQINNLDPILITNQTTLSLLDINPILKAADRKFKNNQIIFKNDLCNATLERQEAILKLKTEHVDLLIVVGEAFSNNTNRLVQIGQSLKIRTIRIASLNELNLAELKNVETVAITAGASTPTIVQMEIIKFLEKY